jgi:cytochrome c oxidase subunit 3
MMTLQETKDRNVKTKKMLLWFAMMSFIMVFAGLTSAFIVSKSRPDWKPIALPSAFWISTVVILISSLTFVLAKKAIKENNFKQTTIYLWLTLALGIAFVFFQFQGFDLLVRQGYFPTGPTANVNSSFLFVLVFMHLVHLFGGLVALIVVIFNHYKQKYNSKDTLGLELGGIFWHFLDFLWLYLFLFLFLFK